jgi:hypothetical protein
MWPADFLFLDLSLVDQRLLTVAYILNKEVATSPEMSLLTNLDSVLS